jgi:hypothetical protein
MSRKMWLGPALCIGGLGVIVMVSTAGATHPRPAGATPIRVSLVPAYNPCAAPNRTHGPPLAFPSCNPPAQSSDFVTVGTPDANGAPASSIGSFTLKYSTTSSDNLTVSASISDVRCKSGTTACGNANAADGPDYVGELEADMTIRVTDHFNAVAPGGGTDTATVIDIPNPVRMFCASTANTSTGGVCNFITGPCPVDGCSSVRDGDRTVAGIGQIRVSDGGADGQVGTDDNTLFAVQGIFIP